MSLLETPETTAGPDTVEASARSGRGPLHLTRGGVIALVVAAVCLAGVVLASGRTAPQASTTAAAVSSTSSTSAGSWSPAMVRAEVAGAVATCRTATAAAEVVVTADPAAAGRDLGPCVAAFGALSTDPRLPASPPLAAPIRDVATATAALEAGLSEGATGAHATALLERSVTATRALVAAVEASA